MATKAGATKAGATKAGATKAGVWIDHKQAIVVLLTDQGQETKKIAMDVGPAVRLAGSSSTKNKYRPNDFVAEDTLERKVENDRKDYYDDVLAALQGVEVLLILGPGEAKGEFRKRISSKKLRGLVIELETADKMTDRQLVAKVQQYFSANTAQKSAAPRKAATKAAGAPKAVAGKRSQKARK